MTITKNLALAFLLSSTVVSSLSFEKKGINRVYQKDVTDSLEDLYPVDKRLLKPISPNEIRVFQPRMDIPDICRPYVPACPPNTVSAGGKCYRYSSDALPWVEAKKDCENQGGMLAIPDFTYNDTVVDLGTFYRDLVGKQNVWIGATDVNASVVWQWVDGMVLDVRNPNWLPGSPGSFDNCAAIHKLIRGPWQIVHRLCKTKHSFLCQFEYFSPEEPEVINPGQTELFV